MKKIIISLFCIAALLSNITAFALDKGLYGTNLPQVSAQGIFLADLGKDPLDDSDDTVFVRKENTAKMYPASLVKILSAIVVLDKYSVDELKSKTATLTPKIKDMLFAQRAATASIAEGETLSFYDLLYCMLLPSGCDAAEMLADKIGEGDRTVFVSLMNTKAHQIGATSSVFTNPTGLHDAAQYTTVSNMEAIAKYALYKMRNKELFRQIVASAFYSLPKTNKQAERKIFNTNKLISDKTQKHEGVFGVKTGTTTEAGTCLITLYKNNSFEILSIVMKSVNNDGNINAFSDTKTLLDFVNNTYSYMDVAKMGNPVYTSKLLKGEKGKETVPLYFSNEILKIVPKDLFSQIQVNPTKDISVLTAPLKKGQVIAPVNIMLNGEVIATADLIVNEEFKKDIKYYIYELLPFVLGGILVAALIFLAVKFNKRRRHHYRRY